MDLIRFVELNQILLPIDNKTDEDEEEERIDNNND